MPSSLAAVALPQKAWGSDFDVLLFGESAPREPFRREGAYAVVDIVGPMTQKPGLWGENYEEIRHRFEAAAKSEQAAIALKIDSPGGDFAGMIELSRELRAMARGASKRLVAFTDSRALSAAFAVAVAADEIVVTPSAALGSIGVWQPRLDLTAQDAMMGVKVAIASSGDAKTDSNPHVGITDEAFARMKAQVEEMAEEFFDHVAESRSMPASKLRALEGEELRGQRALAAGLCDRVVNSWSDFLNEGSSMNTPTPKGAQASMIDEAKGLLHRALEEGTEEEKKAAKQCLKALEPEPKEGEGEGEGEGKGKGKGKKAEGEGEGEGEGEAKALAVKLAADVASLKADIAARDAAEAKAKADAERSKLYASRPDLSEAQRKALDAIPLDQAKAVVATWPRVHAAPGSAAAALTAPVSGGERTDTGAPARNLSPQEQAVFDRGNPFGRGKAAARASFQGNEFVMPARMLTNEDAAARVAELEKEFGGQ